MENKAIAVLAAFILIIIGLLIANYVCSECLFEFPEFEGGSTGGGYVPSQGQPSTGVGWGWILIPIIIIALLMGCKWSGKWPIIEKEGVIKGIVTNRADPDEGVSGATITIEGSGGSSLETNTGLEGKYRVNVEKGTYIVKVHKNGWSFPKPEYHEVNVKRKKTSEADFTLEKTGKEDDQGTIEGKAVDTSGNALEKVKLSFTDSSGNPPKPSSTDANGKYSITLNVGHWVGTAVKSGYDCIQIEPSDEVDLKKNKTEEMNFVLKKTGRKKKKGYNYPLIPREILGDWRKEILSGNYCEKVGSISGDGFSELIDNRLNKSPYPTYLLFKGWITSAKPGNDRFHLSYPHEFCRKPTPTFEDYMRKGLATALKKHGTFSKRIKGVPKNFLTRMVEAYARVDTKGVEIKDMNDNTKKLFSVFEKFGGSTDDLFKEIKEVRKEMGADEVSQDVWNLTLEILNEGNFISDANKLNNAYNSAEDQVLALLTLVAELKGAKGGWRAITSENISERIHIVSKTIDESLAAFSEFMNKVMDVLDKKLKKSDKEYEQVLVVLDEIVGPPLRIMVGRIGILALVSQYATKIKGIELKEV